MATLPLVPQQMDAALIDITLQIAGLTLAQASTPQTPNYYGVRAAWQTEGQPFETYTEDVVTLQAVEVDDAYNKERYFFYEETQVGDEDDQNEITNYTRVWEVRWVCYGPNSFDNARLIHSALFKQPIHDAFQNSQLYLVTDPASPQRLVEYDNGQWWERCDFTARFNEFVTEVDTQATVISAEVIVENATGIIADITTGE